MIQQNQVLYFWYFTYFKYLFLSGDIGCTAYKQLVTRQQDDYEKNRKNTFVFDDKPIGKFLCAKVGIIYFTPIDYYKVIYIPSHRMMAVE